MILKVNSERTGEEYTVDTTNVTCTCKGWIFGKKRFMIGDPERMCKHIRKVFDERPELFPKVCIDAEKAAEAAEEESQNKQFSNTGFIRSEFTPLVSTIRELFDIPGNSLVTSGEYRLGTPTITKATLLCGVSPKNYGKSPYSSLNATKMNFLGILPEHNHETNVIKFTFVPMGMKVVEVRVVKLSDLIFERLFETGPKESILELINKATNNDLKLTRNGFEGIPNNLFPDERSIYDKLGLLYPFERQRYYDI